MAQELLATILYEDQRGPSNKFGLHKFVLRCLCDQSAVAPDDQYRVDATIDGRQLKGNSKLLHAVRNDLPNIAANGRPVIAMFDNDRIRDLLKLPDNTLDDEVCAAIHPGCGTQLHVVLLKENTESILLAAEACARKTGVALDPDMLQQAIKKKEPPARDALFIRISKAEHRELRDCIREKVASLTPLIDHLARILSCILPSPARA
jgi:hypothetical protein